MIISRKSKDIELFECLSSDESIGEFERKLKKEHPANTLLKLKEHVRLTLESHINKSVPLSKMLKLFEFKLGHSFNIREYGQESMGSLLNELEKLRVARVINTPGSEVLIKLLPYDRNDFNKKSIPSNTIDLDSSDDERWFKEKEAERANQEKVKYDEFILNLSDLPTSQVKAQIIQRQVTNIVISNIINPCYFQIQREENLKDLEELMNQLEKIYYGFGASFYDMAVEDIQPERLCAATFYQDNQWHRCKIVDWDAALKKVKVFYLDYGGYELVDLCECKFLDKLFAKWPVTLLDAKLYKITRGENMKWDLEILEHMLTNFKGNCLTVEIKGMLRTKFEDRDCELISLIILDKAANRQSSKVAANVKVLTYNSYLVRQGLAVFYDEERHSEFTSYDLLRQMNLDGDTEADASLKKQNDIDNDWQVVKFLKSNVEVVLFKIEAKLYVDSQHVAAILKTDENELFNLFAVLDLKQEDYFRTFKRDSNCPSGLFDLYSRVFREKPRAINFFLFEKINDLIDIEADRRKVDLKLKQIVSSESYLEDLDDFSKTFNSQLIDEMNQKYAAYLTCCDLRERKLRLEDNLKFKKEYRDFVKFKLDVVLASIGSLEKKRQLNYKLGQDLGWIVKEKKQLNKQFDCLYKFIDRF
jgi:hypothetical protein